MVAGDADAAGSLVTARLGILGAMEEEVGLLRRRLAGPEHHPVAGRTFTTGRLGDHAVVLAECGFGKVAAAATTSTMLDVFDAGPVIFTGVAGGIGPGIAIGDVVVADALAQHDFDASPIVPRFVVPSVGGPTIPADSRLTRLAAEAAAEYLTTRFADEVPHAERDRFSIGTPRVHTGLVASGDRFISDPAEAAALAGALPGLLAVEMEGAATAQVCAERSVPFAVVRSISDRADHHAPTDFTRFVIAVAGPMGSGIVETLARLM
jgi:adenosylhomocysteine nucleosidase